MADQKASFDAEVVPSPTDTQSNPTTADGRNEDEAEVFGTGGEGVNFRTVGWMKAAIFCLKMTFATGVLSIPASLYTLGAVAGSIFILFCKLLHYHVSLE
jgi:hypothetical protein